MTLKIVYTKQLFIFIIYILFIPISFAHLGDDGNILLTKPNRVNQVKETDQYKVSFSYYLIGNKGIIDFSVQIENINSGFFYSNDIKLQIVTPNGTYLPPYNPFIDDKYNYKMRQFLLEKGDYKLFVYIDTEISGTKIEFPFVISETKTENLCSWCSMLITNTKTAHYLHLKSGEVKKTCCVHCALHVKEKFDNKLQRVETHDYFSDKKIADSEAWFVKDSTVVLKDSMAPYILAFSSFESAKKFQKEYQGHIVDYDRLQAEINDKQDQEFTSNEIGQLLFLEELFYNIKKNYYEDLDIKQLVRLSVEKIMDSLDRDSSLKNIESSSLDFLRGFDRDKTIEKTKILDGSVGYIKIIYFGRRTKENFKKLIKDFHSKKITSLIIDLGNNPGGNLDEAMHIMQYFVPNNSVLASIKTKHKQKSFIADTEEKWEYPLIILINENTASSAEIFAASLRYYKKAILIGKNSYGKSTIQQAYPLNNEYTLFLTTGKCYLPDGNTVTESGIKPDHYIENEEERLSTALRMLDHIKTSTMPSSE